MPRDKSAERSDIIKESAVSRGVRSVVHSRNRAVKQGSVQSPAGTSRKTVERKAYDPAKQAY